MSKSEKQVILEALVEMFDSLNTLDSDYFYASGKKGDTPFVVFFARNDIVDKAIPKLDKIVKKHDNGS